jgi:hypothetical protein
MNAIFIGYLAASVCICLPAIYWITAPDWWRSRAGRALMMLLSSLGSLLLLLLASGLLREHTVIREALRYVIYSYVLVAGVRLAVLFFQLRFGADWAKNRGDKP